MITKEAKVLISVLLALRLVQCHSMSFGRDESNQLSATPPPGSWNWSNYSNRSIMHSSDKFSSVSPYWFVVAAISLFLFVLLFSARYKDCIIPLQNFLASCEFYELKDMTTIETKTDTDNNTPCTQVEMDVYRWGAAFSHPRESHILKRKSDHTNLTS